MVLAYGTGRGGGGTRMTEGGIRLVHELTKRTPKHLFLGLKFASLNKYSSEIWQPKQGFFFLKPLNKVMMQLFYP